MLTKKHWLAVAFGLSLLNAAAFAQSPAPAPASVSVQTPWARATPGGATTAAAYMKIDNAGASDDRLASASSPIADKAQVHEMTMTDGVMKMRELDKGLPIAGHGSVTLAPGGYHIMLIGIKKPLKRGDSFPVSLTFEKAGTIQVSVPVEAIGAAGPAGKADGGAEKGAAMKKMDMKGM